MRRTAAVVLLVLSVSACGEDTSTRPTAAGVTDLCRLIRAELVTLPTAAQVDKVAEFLRGVDELPVSWTEAEEAAGRALTGHC